VPRLVTTSRLRCFVLVIAVAVLAAAGCSEEATQDVAGSGQIMPIAASQDGDAVVVRLPSCASSGMESLDVFGFPEPGQLRTVWKIRAGEGAQRVREVVLGELPTGYVAESPFEPELLIALDEVSVQSVQSGPPPEMLAASTVSTDALRTAEPPDVVAGRDAVVSHEQFDATAYPCGSALSP